MATDGPVMRFNDIDYAASDERLMMSVMLGALGGGPFSARSGKRPGNTGLQATVSGLDVTVTPGPGVIYDPAFSSAGPYLFANIANRTIPLGDTMGVRPGAGQTRIDLIVARITDSPAVGGVRELKIVRVPGSAAPTPSAPALPPLSMEVARATVPASGAVSLTVSTARTVAAGGVLPVATTNERDLLPSAHAGLTVYVEADDSLYVRGTTSWKKYVYQDRGDITSTPFWTPTGADQTWTRHDRIITLSGGFTGASNLPTTATGTAGVQLNGPPLPSRDRGLLIRSGNRVLSGWINPSGLLQWAATIGTGNSTNVTLDGLTYEVPN